MTALSDNELLSLGYGTDANPHVSVHFDLFPHVYFRRCRFIVGTTVDNNGGIVCEDLKSAKEYALTQFDELTKKEMAKLEKFRHLIPNSDLSKFSEDDKGLW